MKIFKAEDSNGRNALMEAFLPEMTQTLANKIEPGFVNKDGMMHIKVGKVPAFFDKAAFANKATHDPNGTLYMLQYQKPGTQYYHTTLAVKHGNNNYELVGYYNNGVDATVEGNGVSIEKSPIFPTKNLGESVLVNATVLKEGVTISEWNEAVANMIDKYDNHPILFYSPVAPFGPAPKPEKIYYMIPVRDCGTFVRDVAKELGVVIDGWINI